MKFEVYCDEAYPELFASKNPTGTHLVIGSLWVESSLRATLKSEISRLKDKNKLGHEFKWHAISPSRENFYADLIELFFSHEKRIRFRCIAVERDKVNLLRYHQNDQELGFYKFYYQLLHHWIFDFNTYSVFCDVKKNREPDRLSELARCLRLANLSSEISCVQAVPSQESVLIQLTDVLTGIAAAKLNGKLGRGAKFRIASLVETKIGKEIAATGLYERKFNVFVPNLKGGW